MPFKPKDYLGYASQHRKLLRYWYDIVEVYANCNITKAEDRLPAIAGVAKRMSALTGFLYLAGLWLEDIVQGLCWESGNALPQTSSKYLGPTWSWVPLARNNFPHLRFHGTKSVDVEVAEDIKIEDINIKYATADEFMQVQEGSSLRITGLCCGSEYTAEPVVSSEKYIFGWNIHMGGKLQFYCQRTQLDNCGSVADRKLTFLHLGRKVFWRSEAYAALLMLENSAGDSEKYVRAGFFCVPMREWKQTDLEFWSVQSVTII